MKRLLLALFLLSSFTIPAAAQAPLPPQPPPPQDADDQGAPLPAPPQAAATYAPEELDRIVSPIALYPDALLGQILTAAMYSPEIPDAARWANQHHYVPAAQLPAAIAADELPWQPSVQALLPFPQVLDMMASAMPWTEEIGGAFLEDADQVMDAVQRRRQMAYNYGYLRSTPQVVVRTGPFIEIESVDPGYVVLPYYNPAVVYARPRGSVVGVVRYGYGVRLGVAFAPWGWGTTRFSWGQHVLVVNDAPWHRTWATRAVYVHPYAGVPHRRVVVVRTPDHHELHERSARERADERTSHAHTEQHHDKGNDKDKDSHDHDHDHDRDHDRRRP